jgi:Cof subfamily protein (haloacid dehalogenase superfamily)
MIKFIATDLDGTLYDKNGNPPPEIFPIAQKLFDRGVLFAPASGRQYANLEKTFEPIKDKAVFIAENGALIRYRGKTISLTALNADTVASFLKVIRKTEGLYPILCCENEAYIEDTVEPFFSRTTTPYSNYRLVDNLDGVVSRVPCCKISIFSTELSEKQSYPVLAPLAKDVKFTLSGGHWCDVSHPLANKGEAVKKIQKLFGIKREESLAFGDHMNDVEMLRACAHTAAPKNAYPLVKAQVEKIIPSNVENGVIKALSAMLEKPSTGKGVPLWTKNLS